MTMPNPRPLLLLLAAVLLLGLHLWLGGITPAPLHAQGATPPAAANVPVIRQPPDGANLLQGALGVMTGSAAGGKTGVVLKIYDANRLLGETTSDAQAIWTFSLPDLAPGAHTLTVWQDDENGNPLISSPVTIVVVAATLSAERPTLLLADKGAVLDSQTPILVTGTGLPDSAIQIFNGATLLGQVNTDPQGGFAFLLPLLPPGAHSLAARQLDASGAPVAVSFPLDLQVGVAGGPPPVPDTGSADPFPLSGLAALLVLGIVVLTVGLVTLRRNRLPRA
jgi:hypothetical protein